MSVAQDEDRAPSPACSSRRTRLTWAQARTVDDDDAGVERWSRRRRKAAPRSGPSKTKPRTWTVVGIGGGGRSLDRRREEERPPRHGVGEDAGAPAPKHCDLRRGFQVTLL
ncbi:Os01g0859800 [Oryza sativa Japonica Group]|uniref:Os01g0859800 protein n=1 Tax=Oryza sativa subsp. japonica TaxID=39947 RepID=A0A0P0VAP2_ORYSJ|nr:Os01g0859800 [Oryza sativa Japonica Group]